MDSGLLKIIFEEESFVLQARKEKEAHFTIIAPEEEGTTEAQINMKFSQDGRERTITLSSKIILTVDEDIVPLKIREDLNWFSNPPSDIENYNYHAKQDGCPANEEEWERFRNSPSLSDEELEEIKERCETNSAPEIPEEIIICIEKIESYIKEKGVDKYDGDIIMEECILRKHFIEEHDNYEQEYLELIFEERDKWVLKEVEFIEELHEELRSQVSWYKINESLGEKRKNKNISSIAEEESFQSNSQSNPANKIIYLNNSLENDNIPDTTKSNEPSFFIKILIKIINFFK